MQDDALHARKGAAGICLSRKISSDHPLGFNVDSTLIFDMRADARVEGVEMLIRASGTIVSERIARRLASGFFHDLFLIAPPACVSAEATGFRLGHKGKDRVEWLLGQLGSPSRYYLGGGGFADIEDGCLVRIGVDFQT